MNSSGRVFLHCHPVTGGAEYDCEAKLSDKFSEEELFAIHKKKTEKLMKLVIAIAVSVFIFTLYFFLKND